MFGFGDGPLLMTPERMEMLAREMAVFKPDLIHTHWKQNSLTRRTGARRERHRGRSGCACLLGHPVLRAEHRECVPVGFVPDHYVDITEVFEQKLEALRTLAAQPRLVPTTRLQPLARHRVRAALRRSLRPLGPKPPVYELLSE